ncbi:hypothetical protein VN97_g4474 [Penicillium thymicola]|uniref:Uncharacterized protein n=1 Tax=Penicillium thymicola TaxID=293382 RepID=A0AAI9TK78_PENTH|nr:hypothetical protein VN97_g4474 [Penicillium thymicola]
MSLWRLLLYERALLLLNPDNYAIQTDDQELPDDCKKQEHSFNDMNQIQQSALYHSTTTIYFTIMPA